jgi:8-oxo-dGTP diphosphatase
MRDWAVVCQPVGNGPPFDKANGMGYSQPRKEASMSDSKRHEHPSVTVDVLTVVRHEGRWSVLLVKRRNPPFAGQWAIPGGFVEPDEPLEAAARRELREETGADPDSVEQLHTFGEPGRDPRGWTISVAYLAVLDAATLAARTLRAGSDAGDVGWFDLENPPPLAFDHAQILAYAARKLAART